MVVVLLTLDRLLEDRDQAQEVSLVGIRAMDILPNLYWFSGALCN